MGIIDQLRLSANDRARAVAAVRRDSERKFEQMKRLQCLIQNDVLVNAHYRTWLNGGYASFEDCLVSLVIAMAERKTAYGQHLDWTIREARQGRKPCTCTGTCKGAEGLGEGWFCVMEKAPANDPDGYEPGAGQNGETA